MEELKALRYPEGETKTVQKSRCQIGFDLSHGWRQAGPKIICRLFKQSTKQFKLNNSS
jgi:hypothetical protein